MESKPEYPVYREFKLLTAGKEPGIDGLAIIHQILSEMKENERSAALFWIADKNGYVIAPKRS